MKDIIDEFFDVSYIIKNDKINKVGIKIKKTKLPVKPSHSNGSSIGWYIDKFGENQGKIIFGARRKYNAINEIVYYLLNTDISTYDKNLLKDYVKIKNSQKKQSIIKTYANPKFKKKFKQIVNKTTRIEKISNASKKMWNDAKMNNLNLYYRMINSSKNKNYVINDIRMNSIEYQMGNLLNELEIEWVYESIINIKNNTYLPDFYCKKYNLIIECYGDFWHANPDFMNGKQYTHKNRSVIEIHQYDKNKLNNFINDGYDYLYFWESDILNNLEKIKTQIKNKTK